MPRSKSESYIRAAHEQRLLDMVSSLPDSVTFANLGDLLRALGLPVEHRPS